MLEIETVQTDSAGDRAGLRPGDRITRLNGEPVRDLLDFHFHSAGEETLSLEVVREALARTVTVARKSDGDWGLAFVPMKTRLCGNECVFCFVDQNPAGVRPTLDVKDEDYRLSFLHGNFVTLTNLKEWEIRRIVEQRLSPIYISVHSTNPETRRRLIRSRKERDIMPILDYFRDHEITMHTQIVFCPGYNDGEDLEGTIRDLAAYYPAIRSLAIVPLGMTDHRKDLVRLAPVTDSIAERTLAQVAPHQRRFRKEWGISFVYMADEWYRRLGRPVPPATHYDGFPQIENGIGMTRHFLNTLARMRTVFPEARRQGWRRLTLVTSEHFRTTMEESVRRQLRRTGESVEIQVIGVLNDFLGHSVTVTGLLVGRDILRALDGKDLGDAVVLPPATLNQDDLFLDDTPLSRLEDELPVPVQVGFRDRLW